MADALDGYPVVFEGSRVTLTRFEVTTIIGGLFVIASLGLPWVIGRTPPPSGFEYTWMAPAFLGVAILAIVLAVPTHHPRTCYSLTALIGAFIASMGIVFLLRIPSLSVGVGTGLLLFTVGGLLVTVGGWDALIRETSTPTATALVCVGSILVLLVGPMAVNAP